MTNFIKVFLAGLFAGLIGGFLGLGGGIIIIPILTDLFYIPQDIAHATSLASIIFTGLWGLINYIPYESVPHYPALYTSIGALIFTTLGIGLSKKLTNITLRKLFSVYLVVLGLLMLIGVNKLIKDLKSFNAYEVNPFLYILAGGLVGLIGPILGIGGGTILTPIMVLIFKHSQQESQGIAFLIMFVIATLSTFLNYRLKRIKWDVLPGLILGNFLGVPIGSFFAHQISSKDLSNIFGFFLILLGIFYFLRKSFLDSQ